VKPERPAMPGKFQANGESPRISGRGP